MNAIIIVGLGPGDPDLVPEKNYRAIVEAPGPILVRTRRHPAVKKLVDLGMEIRSFDSIFQAARSFDEACGQVAKEITEASLVRPVAYAVPGDPSSEPTMRALREVAKAKPVCLEIHPAMGYLDEAWPFLSDLGAHLRVISAFEFLGNAVLAGDGCSLLITEIYDRFMASELKERLERLYGGSHEVRAIGAAPGERQAMDISLSQLDEEAWPDYPRCLYVPASRPARDRLGDLVDVVAKLRGEGGCPWDRAQTHESIREYLVEEAYEVIEAIGERDANKLREELGDLLLQVVLHARMAEEQGAFDINDVIEAIVNKMIRRHEHVFGPVESSRACRTPRDVLKRWEAIKLAEKGQEELNWTLSDLRRGWPSVLRAEEVQKAASKDGFDWTDSAGVLAKVREELDELCSAGQSADPQALEDEVGDLLFSVVNLSRFLGVSAEIALSRATMKFASRYDRMAGMAAAHGKRLRSMSMEDKEVLWEECKRREAADKALQEGISQGDSE